jgi:hypothetical protein
MNRLEFTDILEQHLQQSGRALARFAILAYVADAWPLIEDDPDVPGWAGLFIDTLPLLAPATAVG